MPVSLADVGEQVEDLRLDRDVERGDRLVEDQHARLGRERARDRDALALAAGQRARAGRGSGARRGRPGRPARATRAARARPSTPPRCRRSTSSIACAALWRGSRLEYGSWKTIWTSRRGARRSLGAERAGVERSRPQAVIVPAVGAVEADDHPRDGRLARAGLADDRQRAALGHREVDVVDGDDVAELLAQPAGLEHRLRHGASDRRGSPRQRPRSSRARRQRTSPPSSASSGGRAARQASCARAQRGANAQPGGASNADTGRPGIAASRCAVAVDVGRARRERRGVRVQRVVVEQASAALRLDDLPGVHDRRAVAHRGRELEVVGDEQQRQAALAAQLVEDRHHLGLRGHVERGRRLVGEHQARLAEQRRRDHHALQQAAGQLVRVLREAPLAVVDPDVGAAPRSRARRGLGARARRAARSVSVMKSPIRRTGLMCARGSWKTIATSLAVAAQLAAAEAEHVAAVEADRAARLRAGRQQPRDRPRGHRLARARLADEPDAPRPAPIVSETSCSTVRSSPSTGSRP